VIKDAYNNTCAHRVLSVIPNKDPNRIEQKTINGRYHIQEIGTAPDVANVKALCTYDEWENLVAAAASAIPINVDFDGMYFDGIIRAQPISEQHTRGFTKSNRLYQAAFNMYVSEKG